MLFASEYKAFHCVAVLEHRNEEHSTLCLRFADFTPTPSKLPPSAGQLYWASARWGMQCRLASLQGSQEIESPPITFLCSILLRLSSGAGSSLRFCTLVISIRKVISEQSNANHCLLLLPLMHKSSPKRKGNLFLKPKVYFKDD